MTNIFKKLEQALKYVDLNEEQINRTNNRIKQI